MIIATDRQHLAETERVLGICNACRYCEGLCATFQAMTWRRRFAEGDADYLANLCHNCTACYHDCQYVPPHEFDVNVPLTLADTRVDSYAVYAWPRPLGRLFQKNGVVVLFANTLAFTLLMALAFAFISSDTLFGRHVGPGAFYEVVGHALMVFVAGAAFGFSLLAMAISLARFWRGIAADAPLPRGSDFVEALKSAATMKYLDGGHGEGCSTTDDGFSNRRRYFHQLTMWGFLLCFAATCVAFLYDVGFGLAAPYAFMSVPVQLGTWGGLGLVIGPLGLLYDKLESDPRPRRVASSGMDYAFLLSLLFVSVTGLLLLAFRETQAMGLLLIVHLGFVLAFFVMLPFSKFVHGIYRFAALVRFAQERREMQVRD